MVDWIAKSLGRKLIVGLAAIMISASTLFLVLLLWLYHGRLMDEKAAVAARLQHFIAASLADGRRRHDPSELAALVGQRRDGEGVRRVLVLNPERRVRYTSDSGFMNRQLEFEPPGHGLTQQAADERGGFLRSIAAMPNETACRHCHTAPFQSRVVGFTVVDVDTGGVYRQLALTAAGLAGFGLAVVLLAVSAAWWFLKHAVISPVESLNRASLALAAGDLSARVATVRTDELAQHCQIFNVMAGKLQSTLKEIERQKAFMQDLIDAVPDGLRVIDPHHRVIMANRAYCEQMRLPPETVRGSPCHLYGHDRAEPCPPSLVTCPLYEIGRTGQPIKVIHRHTRPDGSRYHAEVFAASLKAAHDEAGSQLIVESIRDLEKQARITQEQRLSELGQLATGVAHEIHNPLASVRIGLQAILKELEGRDDSGEFVDYLRQVDGEVDKCIEVTRKLLNLSIPPSEHLQLVSLDTLIPDVVSLLQHEADKLGVVVSIDLGEAPLRVLATDSEMRMLTFNMIQNAFHAMPKGGRVTIAGGVENGRIVVRFRDTGVGISDQNLPYIFDPFFSRRADQQEGTGLGLTICRSILDRYSGSIDVDSRVNIGTTFTVSMPLPDGEAAA